MTDTMTSVDRSAIDALVQSLQAAWNAGDAAAFAAPFAEDADFVNIRAEHARGREAIAAGHAAIFRTIYAGSTTSQTLEAARLLNADLALAHVKSELNAPTGPMAGLHVARYSMVLARADGGWQIVAFHNTLQPPQRG
jgi:uncharacterized protein (TIGR02246 family)